MALPTVAETSAFIDETLRNEVDPNGTGAYNSRPGSDNAALISVLTQTARKQYSYAANRKAASITSSAEGTDLDDHLRDLYGEDRLEAQAAVGTVYLQRTGTAATLIPKGTQFGVRAEGTQQAIQYKAAADVAAALNVLKLAVAVVCTQPGTIGNVALVNVQDVLDPLADATWSLYVPVAGDSVLGGAAAPDVIGGGTDEETDDEFKARVAQRPIVAQPGTRAGIIKAATDVPGVSSAVPVEVGDGTGVLYAGDPGYQLPTAISDALATTLEDWRPFGVPISVHPFNAIAVQVSADVYMQQDLKNYDLSALTANAIAAITRYFTSERIRPEEYFLDAIKTAIAKSNQGTQSVALTSPANDVRRPADSSYGAITALNRYYVNSSTISIVFHGPLTS